MGPGLPHLGQSSVLQQPGVGLQLERRRGELAAAALHPSPSPPSPLAELTLDKQLQSIYLGPYGAGEQVCGNEEPSSN